MKTILELMCDAADWTPVPPPGEIGALPYVTHKGVLPVGGHQLECVQLSTGERIFTRESIERFYARPLS